jgi:hypothetical protein
MFAPIIQGDLGIFRRGVNIRDMFAPIILGDLGIFRRGVNIRDMFAPIILGDLGIFRTVVEFGRSEVLSYRDNLSIQGHDECPRCNTEVTQGQDPRALGVDFIPNTNQPKNHLHRKPIPKPQSGTSKSKI